VDEIVKRAFDIANYAETFSAQKKILKEEFNQGLIFFQNGGTFTITKELICFVKILADFPNNKTVVLVDDNHSPIEIADVEKFLEIILSKYNFAVNGYYTKYSAITSARSVESILDK
jgi:hypothetical protein